LRYLGKVQAKENSTPGYLWMLDADEDAQIELKKSSLSSFHAGRLIMLRHSYRKTLFRWSVST
jgi:hypothetical protein